MATIKELFETAARAHHAGNLSQAEAICRHIIQTEPRHAGAHLLLGLLAHQANQYEVALELIRQAIALNPDDPVGHFNLGIVLMSRRETAEAIASYRQSIYLNPNFAPAHNNLGSALKTQGKLAEASECHRQALRVDPQSANAYYNLGNVLVAQGKEDEAVECFEQSLHVNPRHVDACINLGVLLKLRGRAADAAEYFRHALRLNPRNGNALRNLGVTLQDLGRLDEAIEHFRRLLQMNSADADAHCNMGLALKDQGHLEEAIACFKQVIRLQPRHLAAHINLGNVLKDLGLLRKAVACYRRAVALKPSDAGAYSCILNTLHFMPGYDSVSVDQEHRRWNEQHALPVASLIAKHDVELSPERRLRIGYVSPDFRSHVLALSFVPLFSAHNHSNYEIVCYADVAAPDEITNRLRSHADAWRNIVGLSDDRVAEMIRQDRIDILVDLTMHMARNRLLVFARKPAPIQATWGAYPGTTGLTTIDYRLTDPYLDPPANANLPYAEESLRLPDSFWCYDPLTSSAVVSPLPALKNGFTTFGCLNNFCKINVPTLKLWSKVLRAVASSRLVLLAPEGRPQYEVRRILAREGIASERVAFTPRLPRRQYLELYGQIDIGLDSVPYNGHMTSLDSYWMGVPVVTMVAQTIVGRAGYCQLKNLGMPELIASTPDEFVNITAGLASDLARLGAIRATLRQRLQDSPLMDAARFASNVESAYREMWRRHCSKAVEAS